VEIELNGQCKMLPLFVVDRGGPPVFGQSWLHEIRLDWTEIDPREEREIILREEREIIPREEREIIPREEREIIPREER
jgi:hypothetical protein